MYQLLQFLIRQRGFFLFIVLELISIGAVFTYNNYQHAFYFNTSNSFAANLLSQVEKIKTYHNLLEVNEVLSQENARLQNELFQLRNKQNAPSELPYFASQAVLRQYQLSAAKIIVQSTHASQNYLTIDKGFRDGIRPGMAVISSTGIVGKVISCTENLSLVISVLNTINSVSGKIKKNGELGFVKWSGWQPEVVDFMDVSKYKKVSKGDTIVTSDYNSVFPRDIPIGVVAKLGIKDDGNFHDIKVLLFTKFNTLQYVYVVKNTLISQQQKLEEAIPKSE
ncbi:rod shape-determining protein MreC [Sandaracinomonas limnophila]|uniref:Cell shape-determining protein MreC n=1 Tax=Sandaracinomonas limnophila TaxID=1862386 RepID=A0A437PU89_9BACT|nr:rod shape-determining protein MreC [Sandaracinomonas limnophila]RVU25800.1 rod shape-determining protein MreC [Sandaracinomonas limnophila]